MRSRSLPALLLTLAAAALHAQGNGANVPVRNVVLFSSGVGFFEHAGTVRGNTTSELRFKTAQINDILKSLVLQDEDGGRVSAVTYPSQDPVAKTLRSFQVDITSNPSMAELLNQLRGAAVSLTTRTDRLKGTILGVELRKVRSDGQSTESPHLNILAGATIRSIELQQVTSLTLDDARLQEELNKALVALTQARDQDKKPVSISFSGAGERRVRIGYVVESPIWKASYRLILGDSTGTLQGWAIVENQTENDWNDVSLSLVSGRPVSFTMDLYQPLYGTRPLVAQGIFGAIRPQLHESGTAPGKEHVSMSLRGSGGAGLLPGAGGVAGVIRDASTGQPVANVSVQLVNTGYGALTNDAGIYTIPNVPSGTYTIRATRIGMSPAQQDNVRITAGSQESVDLHMAVQALTMNSVVTTGRVDPATGSKSPFSIATVGGDRLETAGSERSPDALAGMVAGLRVRAEPAPTDMTASAMTSTVQSVATAAQLGELFQYTVRNVTLPRQKSAMLPIVVDSIALERVSIYNAAFLPRNPLNGVRIRNTTANHLLAGPLTILEDGSYAGDARIDNLPPGQDRLVSYGVDLELLVDNTKNTQTVSVVTGRIARGLLTIERKFVSTQEYRADNKGTRDRQLIIEHPVRPAWKLDTAQKPIETTGAVYRFQGTASAGKVTTLTVTEEQTRSESIAMLSSDVTQLVTYSRTGEIPARVREAIGEAVRMRRDAMETESQAQARTQRIEEIAAEQERIRENMKTVGENTQYYRRLLAKLNEQESQIERLHVERDELQQRAAAQGQALGNYLATLNITN